MNWIVEQIPELTGYTVEWAEPGGNASVNERALDTKEPPQGNYYLSRRNRIFHSTDLKPPFKEIGRVDAPFWKKLASNFRLGQRLLRFMVYNVVPLANGEIFVTFDKTIGVIKDGKYRDLAGLIRPCRVLRFGCAVDADGNVFFGEYLANTQRGEMRIYKYPAGGDGLEIAHTFPMGSIKHIHGLYFDKYTGAIYCLTGDDEPECQILRSFDGFKTIEIVGSGDESWRAVSMLFDETHFTYGTDAEFHNNQIFRVNRQTLARETIGEVNGTVFYSKSVAGDLFFTTTAENAPSQKENVATLWLATTKGSPGNAGALACNAGSSGVTTPSIHDQTKVVQFSQSNYFICENLVTFEKDRWPGGLFMFGTIHFPYSNTLDDRLYLNLVGVMGDNKTYCVRRK